MGKSYKKDKLSRKRVDLLNSINFTWDFLEDEWNKKFEELKVFKSETGHTSPPIKHIPLGNWCLVQRREYKKKKLSQERIKLLESIGFKWSFN